MRSDAVVQSASQLAAGLLIGIEPQQNDPIEQHLIAGRVTALQAGEYQLFLGHLLARSLNVTVGDKVRLMVTEASQFTPLGRLPSQRNFTVAGIFNTGSDVDGQLMVTHLRDAAKLLRYDAQTISGWRLFLMTRLWSVSLPNSHCRKIGNGATGVSSAVNCFKRYVWKRT